VRRCVELVPYHHPSRPGSVVSQQHPEIPGGRIQGRPPTDSGLYVPSDDLPKLHLCRVLAMGPGEELENGTRRAMPVLKVGDVVIAKNPWGIGPKDEETVDGGKLSFMRSQDIAAVITGGIVPDVE
jgi:co-chaperonin GroES (HSP10)